MIAQLENDCISLTEYFRGIFRGWSYSMAKNLPHCHHKTCGHRGGRPTFNHGQSMIEKMVLICPTFIYILEDFWYFIKSLYRGI